MSYFKLLLAALLIALSWPVLADESEYTLDWSTINLGRPSVRPVSLAAPEPAPLAPLAVSQPSTRVLPWQRQRQTELVRAEQQTQQIVGNLYRPGSRPRHHDPGLRVVAHRYYDHYNQRYVPVETVEIYGRSNESYHQSEMSYNPGKLYEVETLLPEAVQGAYYRVQVTWEDGTTHSWDYRVSEQELRVEVWQPL
ncbi:MAG: hypothetical protein KC910_35985 [Candidatus Eremiobacteraeota bacterium]|nr:hypothetical protein [Candidatus Eremiobacteraeota bacterium]